ncbi:Arc family DNA-binding protein [Candidatus Riflebacteria bacterium]
MAKKKSILLRINPDIYEKLEYWAKDEFRSVNGQIEYIIREALRKQGRLKKEDS